MYEIVLKIMLKEKKSFILQDLERREKKHYLSKGEMLFAAVFLLTYLSFSAFVVLSFVIRIISNRFSSVSGKIFY